MSYEKLRSVAAALLIIFLTGFLLHYGKPILVPVLFALFLAMLLVPMCRWLEAKGLNRALSVIACVLVVLLFFGGLGMLLGWQISDLAKDMTGIQEKVSQKYNEAAEYISKEIGISQEEQKKVIEKQQQSSGGKTSSMITGVLAGLGGFVTDLILVLVYIFLFLYLRTHLKKFFVKAVPPSEEGKTLDIINSAQKVSQKYLLGMAMMIVALWIMYGIGFSIVGVKHAVFFAILCGVLEIVPFVGNLLGTSLTLLFSLAQGGGNNVVIGILVTYAVVQFFQTYILEPLVVGSEVNLNPLFTILALVAGELVWGIPGMILAIPVMGVTKIIFDHIEALKPYGFLIGEEKKKKDSGLKKKIKSLWS